MSVLLFITITAISQPKIVRNGNSNWSLKGFENKLFVENKGQVDSKIPQL